MSRPLSERVRDWKWWLEQALHAVLGGAIAYAFGDAGGWAAWGLSTVLGVTRELIQNLRRKAGRWVWDGSKADAAVDVGAWSLGAVVGAVIASVIA